MQITIQDMERFTGLRASSNMRSVVEGLRQSGEFSGLERMHRLAHYIPQLLHESMNFRYDRELWGPTKAQARYDIRTDLGNTPQRDGDGKKYMGHTAIQITGKYNTEKFYKWCLDRFENVPNFVESPHLMNTDPWEGVGPIWYWDDGNPTNKSLNFLADRNDIRMITRRINGGYNGYTDRVNKYEKVAGNMLGFNSRSKDDVRGFQGRMGLVADGIMGPNTRGAMHKALLELPPFKLNDEPVEDDVEEVVEELVAEVDEKADLLKRIEGSLADIAAYTERLAKL